MKQITRFLVSTPSAVIVTAALAVTMASMVKVTFLAPEDTPERLSFIINPKVPPLLPPIRGTERPELLKVDVPPPAPRVDVANTNLPPVAPIDIVGAIPTFEPPNLDRDQIIFSVSDKDADPIVRPSPIMPPRFMEGDNSGHCTVRFDVSSEGSPYNVQTTYCTASILERSTVKAVLKWKFSPKRQDGQYVSMHGVENKVTYQLMDENGKPLPE